MTILDGQFAMMLLVADDSADMVRAAIEPVARDLELAITVTAVEERLGGGAPPTSSWCTARTSLA